MGRVEKAVEHLSEKRKQKEHYTYNHQRLKKPVPLCQEKRDSAHEDDSRQPHPAGIAGSLGGKEHYRKLKVYFRRKEQLDRMETSPGIGEKEVEDRQDHDHGHQGSCNSINCNSQKIPQDSKIILPMLTHQQGKDIDC